MTKEGYTGNSIEQFRNKKLSEIESLGHEHVEIESRDDLVQVVEGPLLLACQHMYDKNIQTYMSSASKESLIVGYAEFSVIYEALSEENKIVAERLIHEEIAQLFPGNDVSLSRLNMKIPVTEDSTWGEIEDRSEEIVNEFSQQRLIPEGYTLDFLMDYLAAPVAEDIPGGEVTPEYFERHGYFYEPRTGIFFKSRSDRNRALLFVEGEEDKIPKFSKIHDVSLDHQNEREIPAILMEINDTHTEIWVEKLENFYHQFGLESEESSDLIYGIEKVLAEHEDENKIIQIASYLYASKEPHLSAIGERQIKTILDVYGLDINRALESWKGDTVWLAPAIELNLKKIVEIEDKVEEENKDREIKREHVTGFLQKECFISDFRRYPTDILLRQYDEYFRSDLEYGIVIFPKSDPSSAFSDYVKLFEDLDIQTKGQNCAVRIYECGSKADIARVLFKTQKTHQSEGHKVSFSLLGAHGEPWGIKLGGIPGKSLSLKNNIFPIDLELLGDGAPRIKDFFEDDAALILSSCSTGKEREGGIAQTISEKIGLRVLAPDDESKTKKIEITRNNSGRIVADVEFEVGNKVDYLNGVERQ